MKIKVLRKLSAVAVIITFIGFTGYALALKQLLTYQI